MLDIKVGATYSTSNPDIPEIRVICELSRATDKSGRIIGKLRGYQAQVCDGVYHAPLIITTDGDFRDTDGSLQKMVKEPVRGY